MNTPISPLAQNMTAGANVSPTSGGGSHPPGIPRGFKLGDGPQKLGISGPLSGRHLNDLSDQGLWAAMSAINPNNPGQQSFAPGTPGFAAQEQKRKAYERMNQMYGDRRDAGLHELAQQQHPNIYNPPMEDGLPAEGVQTISNLDEYNFETQPPEPYKVGFSSGFSHPENATAYFTRPATTAGGEEDWLETSEYERDVKGYDPDFWDEEGPAIDPSLWFTGNTSDEARLQNDQIANLHYNYITTTNPWGY